MLWTYFIDPALRIGVSLWLLLMFLDQPDPRSGYSIFLLFSCLLMSASLIYVLWVRLRLRCRSPEDRT